MRLDCVCILIGYPLISLNLTSPEEFWHPAVKNILPDWLNSEIQRPHTSKYLKKQQNVSADQRGCRKRIQPRNSVAFMGTQGNFTFLPYSTTHNFHQLNPGCNGSRQMVREKSGLKANEPQRNIKPCWVYKPELPLLSRQTVYFPLLYGYEGMESIECITVIREHMMELSSPWLICGHTQSRLSIQLLLPLDKATRSKDTYSIPSSNPRELNRNLINTPQ